MMKHTNHSNKQKRGKSFRVTAAFAFTCGALVLPCALLSSRAEESPYAVVNRRGEAVEMMPVGGEETAGVYTEDNDSGTAKGTYAVVSSSTDLSGTYHYEDVAPDGSVREVSKDFRSGSGTADALAIASVSGVQYSNLRELLVAGNTSLRNNSVYSSIEDLEYQIGVLDSETEDMVMNKNLYMDTDPQAAAEYERSASAMSNTLKQLRRRLSRITSETSSSLDETIDSMEMAARTRLFSYNQMSVQAGAKETSLSAAEKNYENTVLRYTAGMATEVQVESAYNNLLQQQNELESYRQQVSSLRRNLLSMFGIQESQVDIGPVPDPEPEAIAAIDFESDKQKAIDSDAAVQRARHQRADSSLAMQMKNQAEAEAMGSAEAGITDSYQQLMARLTDYQAAAAARASAEQDYASVLRKRQAGMLTEAGLISGEAAWLSAQARFTSASISLSQAYDSYLWQVQGIR